MLGSLRFMLAIAVVFSHTGLTPDFHFGAMAVSVFFLIAGYVMTHSFKVNFGNDLLNVGSFYLDRFFRIYPLYLVSLAMVWGFVQVSGYGRLYLDLGSMIVNLTMFPLNMHQQIMNPPAWSLGTEVQFYLLLPFLVKFAKLKYYLLPMSYGLFVIATFGVVPAQQWSYAYLPGTLFFFIIGSIIYDMRSDVTKLSRNIVVGMSIVGTVHLVALSFSGTDITQPYAFESLVGLAVGIMSLILLGQAKPGHKRVDDLLGKLSYPIFLSHVCVLYAFDHLRSRGDLTLTPRGAVALQLVSAVVLGIPLMLLDDRVQILRKRIQRQRMSRQDVPIVPKISAPPRTLGAEST